MLYQIMIHCEIEKEQGNFIIDDVVNGICEKMVRRHPQAFRRGDGEGPDGKRSKREKKRPGRPGRTGKSPAWPGIPAFSNLFLCFRPMKAIINIQVPVKPGSYERIWGGDSNEDL